MKLSHDFGVRAMLSVLSGAGFYSLLITVLLKYQLDLPTILAIVSIAQAPWMLAIGFYFGTRANAANLDVPK